MGVILADVGGTTHNTRATMNLIDAAPAIVNRATRRAIDRQCSPRRLRRLAKRLRVSAAKREAQGRRKAARQHGGWVRELYGYPLSLTMAVADYYHAITKDD